MHLPLEPTLLVDKVRDWARPHLRLTQSVEHMITAIARPAAQQLGSTLAHHPRITPNSHARACNWWSRRAVGVDTQEAAKQLKAHSGWFEHFVGIPCDTEGDQPRCQHQRHACHTALLLRTCWQRNRSIRGRGRRFAQDWGCLPATAN